MFVLIGAGKVHGIISGGKAQNTKIFYIAEDRNGIWDESKVLNVAARYEKATSTSMKIAQKALEFGDIGRYELLIAQ